MNAPHHTFEPLSLEATAKEIARLFQQLANLAKDTSRPQRKLFESSPTDHAGAVKNYLNARKLRGTLLPAELFTDPAWDILLDLYLAQLKGKRVSVSSACLAAGIAPTTALRRLGRLTELGLLSRSSDCHDGRRIFVDLTPAAYEAVQKWVEACLLPD